MARCKNCGRHIKEKYAHETGLCFSCFQRNSNQGGGQKMGFRPAHHEPKVVSEKPSIKGALTGRNDAIFLKNKYQNELDNTWKAIVDMVHFIETKNKELKEVHTKIPSLRKNIEAHQQERADLFTNLGNVLKKETDFEEKMWDKTQEGRKVKSITVKQKFSDSDVDEMRFDSMMDYLKQYPEYASKSTFRKILEKIEQKEGDIRKETENYNRNVSDYNFKLSDFEVLITKAEDKFQAYETIKKEGEKKLSEIRYNTGFLNKFRSEQRKAEANLDLLSHRVDQFKNTLNIIKEEHCENTRKKFTEITI